MGFRDSDGLQNPALGKAAIRWEKVSDFFPTSGAFRGKKIFQTFSQLDLSASGNAFGKLRWLCATFLETMKKIIILVTLILIFFISYNYFTYPNFCQLEEELSINEEKPNQDNWLESYSTDVENELENSSEFIMKVEKAKLFNGPFFSPKIFRKNKAQKLAKIMVNPSSYEWGETTVEYNRHIIFFDKDEKIIGITKIDAENEFLDTSPFLKTMKWGKLSKKTKKDLLTILNN